jgi:hypothetical protein
VVRADVITRTFGTMALVASSGSSQRNGVSTEAEESPLLRGVTKPRLGSSPREAVKTEPERVKM